VRRRRRSSRSGDPHNAGTIEQDDLDLAPEERGSDGRGKRLAQLDRAVRDGHDRLRRRNPSRIAIAPNDRERFARPVSTPRTSLRQFGRGRRLCRLWFRGLALAAILRDPGHDFHVRQQVGVLLLAHELLADVECLPCGVADAITAKVYRRQSPENLNGTAVRIPPPPPSPRRKVRCFRFSAADVAHRAYCFAKCSQGPPTAILGHPGMSWVARKLLNPRTS